MVGIVIVSHSNKVAQGIKELSIQMIQSPTQIIDAGGMVDGNIGTDANRIKSAIEKADDGDGVVVLVDLGSAIMSTEMAIEFLDTEQRERVVIADGPIVEGAIAASLQASIGGSLAQVKGAAEECREVRKL